MNGPNDKSFHDWVRQSMATYRPAYEPADWLTVQRTLRRRRWWKRGILAGVSVLTISLFSWFIGSTSEKESRPLPLKAESTYLAKPGGRPLQKWTSVRSVLRVTSTKPPAPTASNRLHTPQRSAFAPTMSTPPLLTANQVVSPYLTNLTDQIHHPYPIGFSPEETAIAQQMQTNQFGDDSTTYRVLDRNLRLWPDAVIVCDVTTSMYPYTTQLFAWFRRNSHKPFVNGMVFFTDCDSLGQQTQPGGPPGRMFVTQERSASHVLPLLLDAARNTVRNEDDAENAIEALLVAQNKFPEAKHLILVADNISTVKDMALLNQIQKPVHVVICGTTGSNTALAFQPDYYVIARQTNGSLHTLEDDFAPEMLASGQTLRVGSHYYRYSQRKKQFVLTPFTHRPRRFLKFIWL